MNTNSNSHIDSNSYTNKPEIILTGDRATGPLHLGHYVG